jgi:hypothetical protein
MPNVLYIPGTLVRIADNKFFNFFQLRSTGPSLSRVSQRFYASSKPVTLKERLAELIPKEIEKVRHSRRMRPTTAGNLQIRSKLSKLNMERKLSVK